MQSNFLFYRDLCQIGAGPNARFRFVTGSVLARFDNSLLPSQIKRLQESFGVPVPLGEAPVC